MKQKIYLILTLLVLILGKNAIQSEVILIGKNPDLEIKFQTFFMSPQGGAICPITIDSNLEKWNDISRSKSEPLIVIFLDPQSFTKHEDYIREASGNRDFKLAFSLTSSSIQEGFVLKLKSWDLFWEGLWEGKADFDRNNTITANEFLRFLQQSEISTDFPLAYCYNKWYSESWGSLDVESYFFKGQSSYPFKVRIKNKNIEGCVGLDGKGQNLWLFLNSNNDEKYFWYEPKDKSFNYYDSVQKNWNRQYSIQVELPHWVEEKIALEIESPKDGSVYSSSETDVTIQGRVSKNARNLQVRFSGEQKSITLSPRGDYLYFSQILPLNMGKNTFEFFVDDKKRGELTLHKKGTTVAKKDMTITISPSCVIMRAGTSVTFKVSSTDFNVDSSSISIRADKGTIRGLTFDSSSAGGDAEITLQFYFQNTFLRDVRVRVKSGNEEVDRAQRRLLAEAAAKVDAKVKIAEEIYGIYIQSNTEVRDFSGTKDVVVGKMSGRLVGIKYDKSQWDGDRVEVTARVETKVLAAWKIPIPSHVGDVIEKAGEAYVSE